MTCFIIPQIGPVKAVIIGGGGWGVGVEIRIACGPAKVYPEKTEIGTSGLTVKIL